MYLSFKFLLNKITVIYSIILHLSILLFYTYLFYLGIQQDNTYLFYYSTLIYSILVFSKISIIYSIILHLSILLFYTYLFYLGIQQDIKDNYQVPINNVKGLMSPTSPFYLIFRNSVSCY